MILSFFGFAQTEGGNYSLHATQTIFSTVSSSKWNVVFFYKKSALPLWDVRLLNTPTFVKSQQDATGQGAR